MIQVAPQMRILVAIEPADFRKGIDGLARVARDELESDPFSGWIFVFRNRKATAVKILVYDGQGYVLAVPRLFRQDLIGQAYLPKGGSHGSSEAVS